MKYVTDCDLPVTMFGLLQGACGLPGLNSLRRPRWRYSVMDSSGSARTRRRIDLHIAALALLCSGTVTVASAQWVARGELARVLVVRDCDETGGDVAVSRLNPPTVYVCDRVVRLIRAKDPGAEQFYFVHEFGHIALQTSSESAADCWAARELVGAPNGSRALRIAIAHFRSRGDEPSTHYGSPRDRAERIRGCADEAMAGWDSGAASAPRADPRRTRAQAVGAAAASAPK